MTLPADGPTRSSALVAWARREGWPLAGVDPEGDLEDLEPLRDVVGDAQVVGLGESVHAISDFYRLKHRVLRFLVERLGFCVFALESGFAEGLVVDRWVQGGPGELDDVLRGGFTYNMGCCEEFAAQLAWMRDWNRAGREPRLRYRGTDVPGWLGSPRRALDEVVDYLREVDPHLAVQVQESVVATIVRVEGRYAPDAIARYRASTGRDRDRLTAALADLVAAMERGRPAWSALTGHDRFEVALRCAVNAAQFDAYVRHASNEGGGPPMQARDAAMAANIRWMLESVDRGQRIVVGAHNGHVQTAPLLLPGHGAASSTAGMYLRAALGDGYRAIGTTFTRLDEESAETVTEGAALPDAAPAGTMDAVLAEVGAPLLLVDLRAVGRDRAAAAELAEIRTMRLQGEVAELPVGEAFDALVHVDAIHAMRPRAVARDDA